jgi:sugar phosphate isomerase/epimerase
VTPGSGQVNFPEVFARLKKGGFTRGPVVVECLDPGEPEQVIAHARKTRLMLERLLA